MPEHLSPARLTIFVALLRGINVGSGRSVRMADLRSLVASLGARNGETFIQSGNLIFEGEGTPSLWAERWEQTLAERYAFPIPVVVKTASQWGELAADRPFGGWAHPQQLSVTLLDGVPDPAAWAALAPWSYEDQAIELIGDRVWVKTPSGYGVSKFGNSVLEKKLGLRATTRNRATVDTLQAMITARGAPG